MTRTLLALICLFASLLPALPTSAQQTAQVWRVGVLWPTPRQPTRHEYIVAMVAGLREHGYTEERNVVLDIRHGNGNYGQLSAVARELLRANPDVVVAATTPAAVALQKAGTRLPVVMAGVTDPVGIGLIESLPRPGTNFTGYATPNNDISPKFLEFLKIAVPRASRVGVLVNRGTPSGVAILNQVQRTAPKFSVAVTTAEASSLEQIRAALSTFRLAGVHAVIVAPDTFLLGPGAPLINQLGVESRLPVLYTNVRALELGGLMSYGSDLKQQFHGAAKYIDRIFKGAHAAELPVEEPANPELVINRRTAKAIGLEIPGELLLRAAG